MAKKPRPTSLSGSGAGAGAQAPEGAHEWVSFPDPAEERTWVFDVTFLLSSWHCIYRAGCQGVLTGPAAELEQGCCSYGAHFTDDADLARVLAAAAGLTEEQWQFRRRGRRGGTVRTDADGSNVTRLVEGACIFLNRPGFPGGAGCALHRAALEAGARPMDLKPDVCWQLPLRRQDTTDDRGHVSSTVAQWDRHHWGDGGAEFHWWCTSAPEAFAAPGKSGAGNSGAGNSGAGRAVYRSMADELVGLCGAEIYRLLVDYLDPRAAAAGGVIPLPHPAVRHRR